MCHFTLENTIEKTNCSMLMIIGADGMCCSVLVLNIKIVAPPIGKMHKLIHQISY